MMGIATAACAFCVAQSANAADTSVSDGINTTVNSSNANSYAANPSKNQHGGGGVLVGPPQNPLKNIIPPILMKLQKLIMMLLNLLNL